MFNFLRLDMTGQEFKRIREFNKISQIYIANVMGYSTRTPIIQAEKMEFLPFIFPKVLSQIIGLDFTDDNKVNEYVNKLPMKEARKRNRKKNFIRNIFNLKEINKL